MARRAGWKANNKRIRRLWREEGLRVPQRRRKKRLTGIGVAVGAMSPIRPNVIWAMDFQFDTTADGRTIKMLNIIDEFTREALAIEVNRSIDADGVVAVLDRLALIALGLVIGVAVCAMRLSGSGVLRWIGALWVSFLRGVPLLVQLLLMFYLLPVIGINVPPLVAAVPPSPRLRLPSCSHRCS